MMADQMVVTLLWRIEGTRCPVRFHENLTQIKPLTCLEQVIFVSRCRMRLWRIMTGSRWFKTRTWGCAGARCGAVVRRPAISIQGASAADCGGSRR